MGYYPHKYGLPFRVIFPKRTWRRKPEDKKIYLTFDDGPIPEVTEWVLDLLKARNIKATFFCVGNNIEKHPEVFDRLKREGHLPANHTFNHLNGKYSEDQEYIDNVNKCQEFIGEVDGKPLFRPPYGRMTKGQVAELGKKYEIIMWEVLAGDFDKKLEKEKCLRKVKKLTRPGSIILFHDSVKTYDKIQFVLPKYLDFCQQQKYEFELL